mgnify:CR=1 FL=1
MKTLTSQQGAKILSEEAMQLRAKDNPIMRAVIELKAGNVLKIEKKEWKYKSHPTHHIQYFCAKHGRKYQCRKLRDGGYLIWRLQ